MANLYLCDLGYLVMILGYLVICDLRVPGDM